MKKFKWIYGLLGLLVVLSFFGCSKSEMTPSNQNKSIALKEIPALIDSRAGYELLDQYPSFPGGDSLFRVFLNEKISYPQSAKSMGINGKVFGSFIIEKNGSVSNVEILKGIGFGCDEALLNALQMMPVWSPGLIQNNAVRVKLIVPIEFKQKS